MEHTDEVKQIMDLIAELETVVAKLLEIGEHAEISRCDADTVQQIRNRLDNKLKRQARNKIS